MYYVKKLLNGFRERPKQPKAAESSEEVNQVKVVRNGPPVYSLYPFDFNEYCAVKAAGYELIYIEQLDLFNDEALRADCAFEWYWNTYFPDDDVLEEERPNEYQLPLL